MDIVGLSPSAIHIGLAMIVIGFLIQVAQGACYIVNSWRRKPSIDETLRHDYVSRSEFATCREAFRVELQRIQNFSEDNIRRLDGEIKAQRTFTAKSNREIFEELRKMSSSFNKELQDINKSIGRIEGKISQGESAE